MWCKLISGQPKIYDYFVLVYLPDHPRAVKEGYVPEQILVAEEILGRPLSPDEEVRHINGDRLDNKQSNIEIISLAYGQSKGAVSDISISRNKNIGSYIPCKFQKPCWKEKRAPLARKYNIYLPYTCSYQAEGDIIQCSIYWNYLKKELSNEEGSNE